MSRTPQTLAELLERRAVSHVSEGYSFLLGAEVDGPRAELNYAQLYARARTVARTARAAVAGAHARPAADRQE